MHCYVQHQLLAAEVLFLWVFCWFGFKVRLKVNQMDSESWGRDLPSPKALVLSPAESRHGSAHLPPTLRRQWQEDQGVQGCLWLHREFEASLGNMGDLS